jgi:hypothetical protein
MLELHRHVDCQLVRSRRRRWSIGHGHLLVSKGIWRCRVSVWTQFNGRHRRGAMPGHNVKYIVADGGGNKETLENSCHLCRCHHVGPVETCPV